MVEELNLNTMTVKNTLFAFIGTLATALIVSLVLLLMQSPLSVQGSQLQGQEYLATTTGSSISAGAATGAGLVKTGSGALAQIVVTGANTGYINIYDATTTNVNNRTGNTATSSIYLGSLPASIAAGTYTFDVQFNTGLYLDLVSGTLPTSTIMYR